MKTASIATFLTVAASTSSIGSAYERKLSDERRLGMGNYNGDASSKFEKYVDIYQRCCAPDDAVLKSKETECNCPVRTFNKWGFDIKSKWEKKCETKIKDKSDLVALAVANGFTSLVGLVSDRPGLVEVLKSKGKDNSDDGFTVFAPTDEAVAALLEKCDSLDSDQITSILAYHVVPGTFTSQQLVDESITSAKTALDSESLGITATDDSVTIDAGSNGEAKVIKANVRASNGVAHAIDKVLIPPGIC